MNAHLHNNPALPVYGYEGALKRAIDIGRFYGFHLIPAPEPTRRDKVTVNRYRYPDDRIALLRMYIEEGLDQERQPVCLMYTRKVPGRRALQLCLKIFGSHEAVAEALLFHTALSILREHKKRNLCVHINSIGGTNSLSTFGKELARYYRQNMHLLTAQERQRFKRDALLFASTRNVRDPLQESAPQSVNFLTAPSREHFSSVLEYLETLAIPYSIDTTLLGDWHYNTHTIFDIREDEDPDPDNSSGPCAHGERYDTLSQRAGLRKKIPAAEVTIDLPCTSIVQKLSKRHSRNRACPQVYLIQIGGGTRHHLLQIAETLRRARLSTFFSLAEQGLSQQLGHAQTCDARAIAIVGQKEMLEGTVIVRSLATHAQETVPLNTIVDHVKKLCK